MIYKKIKNMPVSSREIKMEISYVLVLISALLFFMLLAGCDSTTSLAEREKKMTEQEIIEHNAERLLNSYKEMDLFSDSEEIQEEAAFCTASDFYKASDRLITSVLIEASDTKGVVITVTVTTEESFTLSVVGGGTIYSISDEEGSTVFGRVL